ncbi:phospho-sugar mutase, partial [Streptomyces abikoensis]
MERDLIAQARTWLAEDPDPETRDELAKLIDAGDVAEIGTRFAGTLQFGTAGLRGGGGGGAPRRRPHGRADPRRARGRGAAGGGGRAG